VPGPLTGSTAVLEASDASLSEFQIEGVRAQSVGEAEKRFDAWWLFKGVRRSELKGEAARRFDESRSLYVHTCVSIYRLRKKQAALAARRRGADAWVAAQPTGTVTWRARVPMSIFAEGVPRTRSLTTRREAGGSALMAGPPHQSA
jgi:hypothetical protein